MKYIYEIIEPDDQEKIVLDAGQELGRLYTHRRNFFEVPNTHGWVVDRKENCYLLRAPVRIAGPGPGEFHFFFKGEMFVVELDGIRNQKIRVIERKNFMVLEFLIDERMAPDQATEFRTALVEAFVALSDGSKFIYLFNTFSFSS